MTIYEELKPIVEKYGYQDVRDAVDEMWEEYEEVEAYEEELEPYDDERFGCHDDMGFNPYMGCYDYDC